jgi:hypothetical protein
VIINVISFWFEIFGVLTPLSAVFQLRVECALFVIYKAGREPTTYWGIGLYELLDPTT